MQIVIYFVTLYIFYHFVKSYYNGRVPEGMKKVPVVKGSLPLVGNGLEFSKDIVGCVKKWTQEYGNIFRVKIFRTDMVIITDRNMLKEFFSAKEDELSLNDTLNRILFANAFSNDEKFLGTIINIIKSNIRIKYDEFTPKVLEEAMTMITEIRKSAGKKIIISEIMMKFIARTSAQCFLCVELTDRFYDVLMRFSHILNKIIILTYFFPKPILKIVLNPVLRYYRSKMVTMLTPLINKYRNDKTFKESPIIRAAVDYICPDGSHLSNEQVGGILICLLYVSTENTALGLSATITDLSINPKYWEQVRRETKKYISEKNIIGLVKNSVYPEICFNESARMNTHIFPLNRFPVGKDMSIGGYYVGNTVSVGVCAPLLMCDDLASDIYSNPKVYNPERFIGLNKESKSSLDLLFFGAYTHLCPGRLFAKLEIKVAISLITNTFKPFTIEKMQPLNYFSTSVFAERNVEAIIELYDENDVIEYEKS